MKNESLFLSGAKEILSPDSLLTEPEECAPFASDWTRLPGNPSAVVLPKTTAQVASILKLCQNLKIPVVPSGGRTGLCGGAVASKGEVVVNLSRMTQLTPVNVASRTVRVQAGAVTQSVHEHCAKAGLLWPIDLAAKGSSEIGGNLSTNAGGVRVIRYGMSRRWVVGLQAVTMNGEILELNEAVEKNNTGYDLVQLIIGSEGTLAVITEATLKLVPIPKNVSVLFFSVDDLPSLLKLFEIARKGPFEVLAFEFFSAKCLQAVEEKLHRRSRLSRGAEYYVLMEIEEQGRVDDWLSQLLESTIVQDGLLAHSSQEQRDVWALREGITESIALTGPVRKYDVSLPVTRMLSFLGEVLESIRNLRIELFLFGHFGDGSPHLNLVKPANASLEDYEKDCDRFEEKLFHLLKENGGSISAEHGVGILRKNWLTFSRSKTELALYHAIKKAFDPDGLLNPGKVLGQRSPG